MRLITLTKGQNMNTLNTEMHYKRHGTFGICDNCAKTP